MAKISGVLTDGAGNIINNCTIELYAKKTTSKVLTQTQAFQVADNGSYTMNVLPCDYEVTLIINGFPPKRLGTIQVFSDSSDGSLNDFLLNPSESEITPEILQQVIDARNHANQAASNAEKSVKNIKELGNSIESVAQSAKTSADNAKASEANAKNIAHSVECLVASASESATIATDASESAKSYSDSAKSYADSASSSATASHNSAQQSSNSANAASSSERNAKTSEMNAAKSAEDAKSWASTVDNSNFIKKTGDETQRIDGQLDVNKLTENGYRVFSLNNSDIVGAFRLMPFRAGELPFGWYFRNGDNYLLNSPQGQALNQLSANYKKDHLITIKSINGQQYINVPSAFAPDGRGYFERAVNGTTRQVGSAEDDAIRNIKGGLPLGNSKALLGHEKIESGDKNGAISIQSAGDDYLAGSSSSRKLRWMFFDFDASRVVPTANENRPVNIGMTPVIYLGV